MVNGKGIEPFGELLVSSDAFHPILSIEGRVRHILQAARMGDLSLGAHVHVPLAFSPLLQRKQCWCTNNGMRSSACRKGECDLASITRLSFNEQAASGTLIDALQQRELICRLILVRSGRMEEWW